MYAVFFTGGKQYRAQTGDRVRIEKLLGDIGATVTFDQVLLIGNEGEAKIGKPHLSGASVEAEIVAQDKAKKVLVLVRRRRKGLRKMQGHRQPYTEVKITAIKG